VVKIAGRGGKENKEERIHHWADGKAGKKII
jgi:hypothetical protein